MRNERFHDSLRTDADAPARRPQVMTYPPVPGSDGDSFAHAIDEAVPGARITIKGDDEGVVPMHQRGPLRPFASTEPSDGFQPRWNSQNAEFGM